MDFDRLELQIGREPRGDRRYMVTLAAPDRETTVVVWFDGDTLDSLRVAAVTVAQPDMRPSALQRFGYGRWLRAAEAAMREHLSGVGESRKAANLRLEHAVEALMGIEAPSKPQRQRPGPKGRGAGFYEQLAEDYRVLLMAGDPAPARTIATKRGYNPITVRGWLHTARKLGHLPPAHRGRAG